MAGDPPENDPKVPDPASGTNGDEALPGEKDGKWSASGKGDQKYEKKGPEKKWGAGNKAPEAPDPNKPKEPNKPKTEVAIKPLYKKQWLEAQAYSSQEGGDDKTFYTERTAKVSAEALGASYDVQKKKAKATVVNAKAEGTIVHAQVDLAGLISQWLFGGEPEPPQPPAGPVAPMAARFLDKTTHGSPLAPGPGSPNVLIGGLPAWRGVIDQAACAAPGAAPHGTGPAAVGSPTVLINGQPAIRMGDWVTEPTGGPNVILEGCPTVLIGMAAGPPPAFEAPSAPEDELPWVMFESVAQGDLGTAEATAKLEGEVDLGKKKGAFSAEIGASAAAAKGELPLKVRLRIPMTSYYLGLGVTGTGTLGSAGVEANAGLKVNDGKKLFEGSAGAGAHLGVGGVAAKFSVDVSEK